MNPLANLAATLGVATTLLTGSYGGPSQPGLTVVDIAAVIGCDELYAEPGGYAAYVEAQGVCLIDPLSVAAEVVDITLYRRDNVMADVVAGAEQSDIGEWCVLLGPRWRLLLHEGIVGDVTPRLGTPLRIICGSDR